METVRKALEAAKADFTKRKTTTYNAQENQRLTNLIKQMDEALEALEKTDEEVTEAE